MFRILSSTLGKYTLIRQTITRSLAKVSRSQHNLKVTICGAAGHCGETVAVTLKLSPHIDELSLYDIVNTRGLSTELNHIDTSCQVCPSTNKLKDSLDSSRIVVVLASAPRLMTADLLKCNAGIVYDIVTACAQYCPTALIVIATNPINSLVPLASKVLKKHGVYNPNRVFGVTTLDIMRTNVVVAQCHGLPIESVQVPVIGGHSVNTVVPVLSQATPPSEFTNEELESITQKVREMHDLTEEKKHRGFVLSGAMAVSRFVISLARALKGETNIKEYAFVRCNDYPYVEYLSTRIHLGIDGVQRHLGLPQMSDYEKCLLHDAVNTLIEDIKVGEELVGVKAAKCEQKVVCSK